MFRDFWSTIVSTLCLLEEQFLELSRGAEDLLEPESICVSLDVTVDPATAPPTRAAPKVSVFLRAEVATGHS